MAPSLQGLLESTGEEYGTEFSNLTLLASLASARSGDCTEVFEARRALLAGMGIVLLQQVTGQPSVLYYQETIFRGAGFGDLAAYASVIVGGSKLLATLFTVARVDQYGRRPLLFVGISMMFMSLVVLAISFHQQGSPGQGSPVFAKAASGDDVFDPWPIAIVSALIVYVCGYQVERHSHPLPIPAPASTPTPAVPVA